MGKPRRTRTTSKMAYDKRDDRSRISVPGGFTAVVIHNVRIINDVFFEVRNRVEKGARTGDRDPEIVTPYLCATSLPNFLAELVSLKTRI